MATGVFGRNPVDVLDKTSLAAMNSNVVKRIDPFVDEVSFNIADCLDCFGRAASSNV